MNSYLVRTKQNIGAGIDARYIVKANSIKEAIIKQVEKMELTDESVADVLFYVTLMEVIE